MPKPYDLVIKVNENGSIGFKCEPPGSYQVAELQELLKIALQIVGQTQLTFHGEKKDGAKQTDLPE
jgi:hypothetical protein